MDDGESRLPLKLNTSSAECFAQLLIFLCIQYSSVVQITKASLLKTAIVSSQIPLLHFVEKVNLLAKELAFQDFLGLHWHIKGKGRTIQIFILLKTHCNLKEKILEGLKLVYKLYRSTHANVLSI